MFGIFNILQPINEFYILSHNENQIVLKHNLKVRIIVDKKNLINKTLN